MATLDDKLLGEKLHYYCSSSEDEEEEEKGPKFVPEAELSGGKTSSNTGPKGVIADWQRYKQLEHENREANQSEKAELVKKLTMTCQSEREEREAKEKEEKLDQELESLLDDQFLAEYMAKRMQEMMDLNSKVKKEFGKLIELSDTNQFLTAIDTEDKDVLVVILIYEANVRGCKEMTACIRSLAQEHKYVKFCQIKATTAGLSKHFKSDGVPALLVYKSEELMTRLVRVTDVLGEDFYSSDVESFLIEHGILRDKELIPQIIRSSQDDSDDTD